MKTVVKTIAVAIVAWSVWIFAAFMPAFIPGTAFLREWRTLDGVRGVVSEWFDRTMMKCVNEKDIDSCGQVISRGDAESKFVLSIALKTRAFSLARDGQLDRAIPDLDQAIVLDINDGINYALRCYVYANKKDYDRALADCGKAISIDPKKSDYYSSRGAVYSYKYETTLARIDYDNAMRDYDKAISLNPRNADAYKNRGDLYANTGDKQQADINYHQSAQAETGR